MKCSKTCQNELKSCQNECEYYSEADFDSEILPQPYSNASRIPPGRYNNEKFDAIGLEFYLFLLFVDHFWEKKISIF